MRRNFSYWEAVLCGGIALIVAVMIGLGILFEGTNLQNEIGLPLLAISGVVALLGVVALVAIVFQSVGLADTTQAMGLPSGSVRAVIALSLIVLFSILSVYLFSNLASENRLAHQACLTAEERQQFLSSYPPNQFHFSNQMSNVRRRGEELPTQCGRIQLRSGSFFVTYAADRNPASDDFAKQLLVLIGTLVTSVAGFYFGAQAVSQAQELTAGLNVIPSLTGQPCWSLGSRKL